MMTLTPAPASPSSPGCRRRLKHHRDRGQAQVRLGLPAAGREEQHVHRIAVHVLRIGETRKGSAVGTRAGTERQCGPSGPILSPRRWRRAPATARLATRKASSRSASSAEQRHTTGHPFGGNPSVVGVSLPGRIPPVALLWTGRRGPAGEPRSNPGTAPRGGRAPAPPRVRRPAGQAPPSTARRPARPPLPSSPLPPSRSTPCGSNGTSPSTSSHSADTPCPVAYSGVSA